MMSKSVRKAFESIFTEEDKKRMNIVFRDVIRKGRAKEIKVGKQLARKTILDAGVNFRDLLDRYSLQQITNRVRTVIRGKADI